MNITATAIPATAPRRLDEECQADASAFLTRLVGHQPSRVCWDSTHHLQGHAVIEGHELIVIAPRDAAHQPLVVTVADWKDIQHAPNGGRVSLLRCRRITTRQHLLDALAA